MYAVAFGLFPNRLKDWGMVMSLYHANYAALRELLRLVRQEAELTQTQLAHKLGVGQSYVSKLERGENFIDVLLFINWCEACGVFAGKTIDRLLK